MKNRFRHLVIVLALFGAIAAAVAGTDAKHHYKVTKTDAQWKKILSPEAYAILRKSGTEQPYSGQFWDNHEKGDYYCAACGQKLFSSETKFDSHTGWPSFWKPVKEGVILKVTDRSLGTTRTEVLCSRCGSHLGHVFDDGPKPTGLRFCINSPALVYKKK